mgnify:CR=1 FL=1
MPRGRVRVLRGGIGGQFKCDFLCLERPCGCGPSFYEYGTLGRPNRWVRLSHDIEHIAPTFRGAVNMQYIPTFRGPAANM